MSNQPPKDLPPSEKLMGELINFWSQKSKATGFNFYTCLGAIEAVLFEYQLYRALFSKARLDRPGEGLTMEFRSAARYWIGQFDLNDAEIVGAIAGAKFQLMRYFLKFRPPPGAGESGPAPAP